MPIVTFTYFLENDPTRYFGKYVTPDYPQNEGIDRWILGDVVKTIHLFQDLTLQPKIHPTDVVLGILNYTESNDWTTYREVTAFDMYIEQYFSQRQGKMRSKRWINGIRIG